jgi:hypothetical protein
LDRFQETLWLIIPIQSGEIFNDNGTLYLPLKYNHFQLLMTSKGIGKTDITFSLKDLCASM